MSDEKDSDSEPLEPRSAAHEVHGNTISHPNRPARPQVRKRDPVTKIRLVVDEPKDAKPGETRKGAAGETLVHVGGSLWALCLGERETRCVQTLITARASVSDGKVHQVGGRMLRFVAAS